MALNDRSDHLGLNTFAEGKLVAANLPTQLPRNRLADCGLEANLAYQIIHDHLMLDGNARLNLATFVGTWMEPEARRLMEECADKNMIDKDEYPQTAELEERCLRMLAELWHAEDPAKAIGTSTTGSSEGCMLGGMVLKWHWRQKRKAAGLDDRRPNLVMGTNTQICWDKFCAYFDVEPRMVPITPTRLHLTGEEAVAHCDENTIGVVGILGSTFDGSYEPIAGIQSCLDELQERTGLDLPIHVDAASGGFVAPFNSPDLLWDFRLSRVKSINTSGHKYGGVLPGVGWVLWREQSALPEELRFNVNYLGGEMPTIGMNFSRPGGGSMLQLPPPRQKRLYPPHGGPRSHRLPLGRWHRRDAPIPAGQPPHGPAACVCCRARSGSHRLDCLPALRQATRTGLADSRLHHACQLRTNGSAAICDPGRI